MLGTGDTERNDSQPWVNRRGLMPGPEKKKRQHEEYMSKDRCSYRNSEFEDLAENPGRCVQ